MDRTCELEAVVRVRTVDDAIVVSVANAFDSGFSTCWPAGSTALLNDFEQALGRSNGTIATRVATAFVEGARSFLARGRTIPPFVPGDEDSPGGALAVAVITEDRARFYVRGGVEALVVRGPDIVARAAPRGLRDWISSRVEDAHAIDSVPDIPADVLSEAGTLEPKVVEVALAAGDRVIVGDWGVASRLRSVGMADLDEEGLARRVVESLSDERVTALAIVAVVGVGCAAERS